MKQTEGRTGGQKKCVTQPVLWKDDMTVWQKRQACWDLDVDFASSYNEELVLIELRVCIRRYLYFHRYTPHITVHWPAPLATKPSIITARRNDRVASAVLATAIPSVRPSVRLSVCHTPVLCQNDCT